MFDPVPLFSEQWNDKVQGSDLLLQAREIQLLLTQKLSFVLHEPTPVGKPYCMLI